MLRKADEHTATQETYEADAKEKLDLTRQRRQEERERILQLEVKISIKPLDHADHYASLREPKSSRLRLKSWP